jgi:hypothetical protein
VKCAAQTEAGWKIFLTVEKVKPPLYLKTIMKFMITSYDLLAMFILKQLAPTAFMKNAPQLSEFHTLSTTKRL